MCFSQVLDGYMSSIVGLSSEMPKSYFQKFRNLSIQRTKKCAYSIEDLLVADKKGEFKTFCRKNIADMTACSGILLTGFSGGKLMVSL